MGEDETGTPVNLTKPEIGTNTDRKASVDPSPATLPQTVRRSLRAAGTFPSVLFVSVLFPDPSHAHIKWFEPYDVQQAPRSPGEVLSSTFIWLFLASTMLIFTFFLVDRFLLRKGLFAELDRRLKMFDALGVGIMRIAGGLYFLSVFAYGYAFDARFYLTPELATSAAWVPWVQLLTGLAALHQRSTPLMLVGILILFAAAVADYGLFHLLDYVVFLALGYFYFATSLQSPGWTKSGFVTLFAATGINFMWLAIEKFAYPQWTFPLLEKNPELLMGIDPEIYMNLAGFVEILIIFTLLSAASVVIRLVAFGFMMLFVSAIMMFGLIDAIGHLMIIAILFVLVVRGPTDARYILVLPGKSLIMEAYFMTGLYYFAIINAFLLYYGLHYFLV